MRNDASGVADITIGYVFAYWVFENLGCPKLDDDATCIACFSSVILSANKKFTPREKLGFVKQRLTEVKVPLTTRHSDCLTFDPSC